MSFAKMTPERQREIASMGGRAAQQTGRAHKFTAEEARRAGAKGGAVVSARPGYMSEIGKRGGAVVASRPGYMAELGKKGGRAVANIPGHMSEIARRP